MSIKFFDPSESLAVPPRQVPALEPPVPVLVRLRMQRGLRQRLGKFWQDTPSWLVSLVAHLTVFLFLGSLLVPVGQYSRLDTLIVSINNDTEDAEQTLQIVELPSSVEQEQVEPPPSAVSAEWTPPEIDIDHSFTDDPQQETQIEPSPASDEEIEPVDHEPVGPQPIKTSRPPELNRVLANALGGVVPDRRSWTRTQRLQRIESIVRHDPRLDQIVDDFIQYDIGRLPGGAGRAAKRRFDRLGYDAVPALVRGLNKAASIRASCPVGVISHKLDRVVRESRDPSIVDYVITNLGAGIDRSAPHYARVMSLRDKIAKSFDVSTIRTRCNQLGIDATDELCQQIAMMLTSDEFDGRNVIIELLGNADSIDDQTRCAAVVAANLRSSSARGLTVMHLGNGLVNIIERERSPIIKRAAHDTAIKLANGLDFGTSPQSADRWREAFEYLAYRDQAVTASPRTLIAALRSGSVAERKATLDGIEDNNAPISTSLRIELGRELIDHLSIDEPEIVSSVKSALVKIAQRDLGSEPDAWTEHWDSYEAEKIHEPKARSLLRSADALRQRSRIRSAVTRYRRAASEFPLTESGKLAAERLRQLAKTDRDILLPSDR